MSGEANKAVIRRWFEALEQGGAGEVAAEIFASQFILHDPGAPPDLPPGPQGVIRFISLMKAAFPDLHARLEDMLAEGDLVAIRFSMRGTQLGTFMGSASTAKPIMFEGASLIRFVEGKMVEKWEYINALPTQD
jgi:predicted SnoaL-like aldol condensation-catalyzing enzyme